MNRLLDAVRMTVVAVLTTFTCANPGRAQVIIEPVGIESTTSPTLVSDPDPAVAFSNPADADLAVGIDHVVVVDNWQIVVYDKATFEEDPEEAEAERFDIRWEDGFWRTTWPNWPTTPADDQVVFDPRVIYDIYNNVFWIVAQEYIPTDSPTGIWFNIAVAEDPTGPWEIYRLDARTWRTTLRRTTSLMGIYSTSPTSPWTRTTCTSAHGPGAALALSWSRHPFGSSARRN